MRHSVLEESCEGQAMAPTETFRFEGDRLVRETRAGSFFGVSEMALPEGVGEAFRESDLRWVWWNARLRGVVPRVETSPGRPEFNIVDLCSGCGGLATGVRWACEAVGVRPVFQLCVDVLPEATKVYKNNLRPLRVLSENIANLVTYRSGTGAGLDNPSQQIGIANQALLSLKGKVDMVIAGPPCEGHSNFNNKSRRTDARNELYVAATACAIMLGARTMVIENVVTVRRARQRVVERSIKMLLSAGYKIDDGEGVLDASSFGTPQRRRRHFLIASKSGAFDFPTGFDALTCQPLSAMDALGDLVDLEPLKDFDSPSRLSLENDQRVRYLIENDVWDLPDEERPVCHQDGNHTYGSIYGRIRADQPSQTITTGFLSPGRGRFTHPTRARGLTPHEGARLQGFPDDFRFSGRRGDTVPRQRLAHLIGDAVPPQLGYVMGLAALSSI